MKSDSWLYWNLVSWEVTWRFRPRHWLCLVKHCLGPVWQISGCSLRYYIRVERKKILKWFVLKGHSNTKQQKTGNDVRPVVNWCAALHKTHFNSFQQERDSYSLHCPHITSIIYNFSLEPFSHYLSVSITLPLGSHILQYSSTGHQWIY